MDVKVSSPELPKGESKLAAKAAQTRAKLIRTALDLLGEREFRSMSLDAIAARAGVTKGAIYGHFKSKDELLEVALFSQSDARPEEMDWPTGRDGTVKQRLRKIADMVLARRRDASHSAAIAGEFIVYAMSSEKMRLSVGARLGGASEVMEKRVLALFHPDELPMPVKSFALLMSALLPGLMFIRAFRGERMTDEQVIALFEGLAD